ncbi:hypothetical protein FOA52_009179 [Chlamydomonas sp. UWO 241]|nr:hypothetical protein FOA52_009179 [Chlamydomonas sp. UWO 241]
MEYMEDGPVLEAHPASTFERFPEDVALDYFRQVCAGLDYLHFNHVVHGDLKPDNLLLTAGRSVLRIADFGSSRIINDVHASSRVSGTPAFQSPEAIQGGSSTEHARAGDVWALGVCLYCFLYGRLPFSGSCTLDISRSIIAGGVQYPALEPTPASPELLDLLGRMLTADPDARITLQGVMSHDWTTRHGTVPMQSISDQAATPIEVTRGQAMAAIDRNFASLIHAKLNEHVFAPGEFLFREHEEAHSVYMIMSGVIEMIATHLPVMSTERLVKAVSGLPEPGTGDGDEVLTLELDESFILEFGMQLSSNDWEEQPRDGKLHITLEQTEALRQRMSDLIMGRGEEYVAEVRGPGQVIGEVGLDGTRVAHHAWGARAKSEVFAVKLTEDNLLTALTQMCDPLLATGTACTNTNSSPSLGLGPSSSGRISTPSDAASLEGRGLLDAALMGIGIGGGAGGGREGSHSSGPYLEAAATESGLLHGGPPVSGACGLSSSAEQPEGLATIVDHAHEHEDL